MKNFSISHKEHRYIFIYYLMLILVCVSWVNTNMVAPNVILRLVVTSLIIIPLIKYIWLLPSVIFLFAAIRFNSVSPFGYLPQNWGFYFITILIIALINVKRINLMKGVSPLMLFTIYYIFLVDIINLKLFSDFLLLVISCYIIKDILIQYPLSRKIMLFSFVLTSIILSIYYYLYNQNFSMDYSTIGVERAYWKDPNYFGTLIGCGVVISMAFLLGGSKNKLDIKSKLFFLFCILISLPVLLLQASRGTLLSISISLMTMILLSRSKVILKILFIIFILIFILLLYQNGMLDLLISRVENEGGSGRLEIWNQKLINLFDSNAYMFGLGFNGNFDLPPVCDPHSDYISVFINYGFVGLILFLIYLYKLIINYKNPLIGGGVSYIAIASMTISPIFSPTGWCSLPFFITLLFSIKDATDRKIII